MQNYSWLKLSFLILFLGNYAQAQSKGKGPYNILLITIDDLRPELGCYGVDYVHSPNIDRLAARGSRFESAYCAVSWCAPSRTSLMTGLRPTTTGVMDLKTHFRTKLPSLVTLPQFFKNEGYTSVGFGKLYHNSPDLQDSLSWSEPCWFPPGKSPILAYAQIENRQIAANHPFLKARVTESIDGPDTLYPDGQVTKQVVQVLHQFKEKAQPFFLGVGYYKPHLPFTAPKLYWDKYEERRIPLTSLKQKPIGAYPQLFRDWSEPGSYPNVYQTEPYSDSLSRHLKHAYLACVSFVDAQIGKLQDALQETGLAENTIIVLWGDHGWKLGEYGHWSKHSTMEVDTHVPLIIYVPGQKPQVISDIVETIDIYPTLVRLAGFEVPSILSGENLFEKTRNFALSHIPRGAVTGHSIRCPDSRYTEWIDDTGAIVFNELYDHRYIHSELENLASQTSYQKYIVELKKKMKFQ